MKRNKVRLINDSGSKNGVVIRRDKNNNIIRDKNYISFGSKVLNENSGGDWKNGIDKKGYRVEDFKKGRMFCRCIYCGNAFYEVWRWRGICIKVYGSKSKCIFIDKEFDRFEY